MKGAWATGPAEGSARSGLTSARRHDGRDEGHEEAHQADGRGDGKNPAGGQATPWSLTVPFHAASGQVITIVVHTGEAGTSGCLQPRACGDLMLRWPCGTGVGAQASVPSR
jgi:hypothetical protein